MVTKKSLDSVRDGRTLLIAVAAPREAEAVLRGLGAGTPGRLTHWERVELSDRAALVLTGVGKANAAGAIARALREGDAGVVVLGLAGSMPGAGLVPLDVVVAESAVLADEGVTTPDGFLSISEVGFPSVEWVGERFATDPRWRAALAPLGTRVGTVATVSACSGTDGAAAEIERRTGALCEDMESAGAGLAALRLGAAFACVRVISNRTGNRGEQGWDFARALSGLERVAASL